MLDCSYSTAMMVKINDVRKEHCIISFPCLFIFRDVQQVQTQWHGSAIDQILPTEMEITKGGGCTTSSMIAFSRQSWVSTIVSIAWQRIKGWVIPSWKPSCKQCSGTTKLHGTTRTLGVL
jgi:hypothetical protein